ncbi:hypothetical protein ABW20_dc0108334 [Dactylellina cionopaga]|nr:hypothetical protein ABW20_dc0108334 [Dactylellina cionopaga]
MQFSIVAVIALAGSVLALPAASVINPPAQCTTTIGVAPHMDLSPTKTIYATTVTAYNRVECNGCVLKTTLLHFGPGPVVFRTATATVATTTEWALKCKPTGN